MSDNANPDYAEGSMAASLAAGYDAAQTMPEEVAEKPAEPSAVEDVSEAAPSEEATPAEATDDEEITDQSADESDEPAEEPAIDPPQSWSAEAKERWASLDRATQEYIQRRETEVQKGFQERGERLSQYKPVEEKLAPLSQRLQAEGVTSGQFLGRLVDAHNYLERDPANAIAWLAKQYGVQAPAGEASSQDDDFADPQIKGLQSEIAELKSHLAEQQRHQQEQSQRTVAQQIEKFAASHEHFDAVKQEVAGLLQSGVASDLEDAYERAVWANPETRKALQEKQEADRVKMAQVRAAKAQKGAKAASAPNGTAAAPVGGKTMRDTMAAVADQMMGS